MANRATVMSTSVYVNGRKVNNVSGIQTSTKRLYNEYTTLHTKGLKMSGKRISQRYAAMYYKHAQKAGIKSWTGRSYNMLANQMRSPERKGTGMNLVYLVKLPMNLIALDRLRQPFRVQLLPGRSITAWAKAHGKLKMRGSLGSAGTISVKRHPFIDAAHHDARTHIRRILEGNLSSKKMRGKRR